MWPKGLGWGGMPCCGPVLPGLCHRPSRPAVPGAAKLHACFLPLPLTQPHFLSASQPPAGSLSPACILSTQHPPGPRASVPHPGAGRWKRLAACRQAPSPRSSFPWPVCHLQTCRRPGHDHPILNRPVLLGFNPSRPFSPGSQPSYALTALCLFRITLLPWAIKMKKQKHLQQYSWPRALSSATAWGNAPGAQVPQ